MKPEDKLICLRALAGLVAVDADSAAASSRNFLPLRSTLRALDPDVWTILGRRGSGKTALFRLATETAEIRRALGEQVPDGRWIACFSTLGHEHPDVGVLESLAHLDDLDLRGLWLALLLRRLALAGETADIDDDIVVKVRQFAPNAAIEWAPGLRHVLGDLVRALDRIDAALQASSRRIFCCYDALDRISPFNRDMRRRHIRALLSLWLSLSSRHRALRAKVFLRDDLLDPSQLEFPDASKLRSRAVSLEWTHEDLSRLVVRYLAQDGGEPMRGWLARIKSLHLRDEPNLGWIPGPMPESVRRTFLRRLVGDTIGTGVFRVESERWIFARLQDATDAISPRTVLRYFGYAGDSGARRAQDRPDRSPRLLSEEDLAIAIQRTSVDRVDELRDEYPIVNRAENLARLTIPIPREDAEHALAQPSRSESLREPLVGDPGGAAVLAELERLGVISEYGPPDRRVIDVPDIYRYGFGIGVDYPGSFRAYILNGPDALRQLQRGELPELPRILADADRDGSLLESALKEAYDRYLAGNTAAASSLMRSMLEVAESKHDLGAQTKIYLLLAEVYLTIDPEFSLDTIVEARATMNAATLLSPRSTLDVWLNVTECLAWICMHNTEEARRLADALEPAAAADPDLRELQAWARGQIALLVGDRRAAGGHASFLAGTQRSVLTRFRGYLLAASLVLMGERTPQDALGAAIGMLPWALSLDGVPDDRLHTAALLVYVPACHEGAPDIVRKGAEQFATAYLARTEGLLFDDLRHEAASIYRKDHGRELLAEALAEAVTG